MESSDTGEASNKKNEGTSESLRIDEEVKLDWSSVTSCPASRTRGAASAVAVAGMCLDSNRRRKQAKPAKSFKGESSLE